MRIEKHGKLIEVSKKKEKEKTYSINTMMLVSSFVYRYVKDLTSTNILYNN